MVRKIIVSVTAGVLVAAIALFAAEKTQEKKSAEKSGQSKAAEQASPAQPARQRGDLLDELVQAYKADDKEKMGQIIEKMQQRRAEVRKLAKLNKWHRRAHRTEGMMGAGWGRGGGMGGMRPGLGGWGMGGGGPAFGPPRRNMEDGRGSMGGRRDVDMGWGHGEQGWQGPMGGHRQGPDWGEPMPRAERGWRPGPGWEPKEGPRPGLDDAFGPGSDW